MVDIRGGLQYNISVLLSRQGRLWLKIFGLIQERENCNDEKNVSAEKEAAPERARIQKENEDQGWPECVEAQKSQGKKSAFRIKSLMPASPAFFAAWIGKIIEARIFAEAQQRVQICVQKRAVRFG